MFLSIVIPVFNAEPFLEECVRSLYTQDIPLEDYEVLCVDDCSSDASVSIIERLAEDFGNLRLICQEHKGVSAARNRGLIEAKGDYVWFVDADDFIAENSLGYLKELAEKERADRIVFETYTFYESLSPEEQRLKKLDLISPNSGVNTVAVWASLFKLSFIREHKVVFLEGLLTSEDALFLYELSICQPEVHSADRVLYYWRRNRSSSTAGTKINSSDAKLVSFLRAACVFYHHYQAGQGDLRACANQIMSNLWAYMRLSSTLETGEFRKYIQRAEESGIFPIRRPKECTLTRSYMTSRTGLIGKLYDFIYTHQHRRWGLCLMRLYHLVYKCIKG